MSAAPSLSPSDRKALTEFLNGMITEALADLEDSDIDAERNRGRITACRDIIKDVCGDASPVKQVISVNY